MVSFSTRPSKAMVSELVIMTVVPFRLFVTSNLIMVYGLPKGVRRSLHSSDNHSFLLPFVARYVSVDGASYSYSLCQKERIVHLERPS